MSIKQPPFFQTIPAFAQGTQLAARVDNDKPELGSFQHMMTSVVDICTYEYLQPTTNTYIYLSDFLRCLIVGHKTAHEPVSRPFFVSLLLFQGR